MLTKVSNKIEIKFTLEQRQQIYRATGLDHTTAIEVQTKNLAALVLAAMAAGSDSLPISSSVETIKKMLARSPDEDKPLFILKVELTSEQQQEIRQITGRTTSSILLAPDELRVNFKEDWKSAEGLLRVGRSIVIVSEGEGYQATPLDIVITLPRDADNTEGVFGTGGHPATQLTLTLMEEWLNAGDSVLDLGTGSGILAVAAARLGVAKVMAVDIEATAVAMAAKTVTANGVGDVVTVKHGGVEIVHDQYDMVVANIFTGVIISLATELARVVVQPSGLLIASGVIATRSQDVVRAVCDAGFQLEKQLEKQRWSALLFRRV